MSNLLDVIPLYLCKNGRKKSDFGFGTNYEEESVLNKNKNIITKINLRK
jgi:hypothetical protein